MPGSGPSTEKAPIAAAVAPSQPSAQGDDQKVARPAAAVDAKTDKATASANSAKFALTLPVLDKLDKKYNLHLPQLERGPSGQAAGYVVHDVYIANTSSWGRNNTADAESNGTALKRTTGLATLEKVEKLYKEKIITPATQIKNLNGDWAQILTWLHRCVTTNKNVRRKIFDEEVVIRTAELIARHKVATSANANGAPPIPATVETAYDLYDELYNISEGDYEKTRNAFDAVIESRLKLKIADAAGADSKTTPQNSSSAFFSPLESQPSFVSDKEKFHTKVATHLLHTGELIAELAKPSVRNLAGAPLVVFRILENALALDTDKQLTWNQFITSCTTSDPTITSLLPKPGSTKALQLDDERKSLDSDMKAHLCHIIFQLYYTKGKESSNGARYLPGDSTSASKRAKVFFDKMAKTPAPPAAASKG